MWRGILLSPSVRRRTRTGTWRNRSPLRLASNSSSGPMKRGSRSSNLPSASARKPRKPLVQSYTGSPVAARTWSDWRRAKARTEVGLEAVPETAAELLVGGAGYFHKIQVGLLGIVRIQVDEVTEQEKTHGFQVGTGQHVFEHFRIVAQHERRNGAEAEAQIILVEVGDELFFHQLLGQFLLGQVHVVEGIAALKLDFSRGNQVVGLVA